MEVGSLQEAPDTCSSVKMGQQSLSPCISDSLLLQLVSEGTCASCSTRGSLWTRLRWAECSRVLSELALLLSACTSLPQFSGRSPVGRGGRPVPRDRPCALRAVGSVHLLRTRALPLGPAACVWSPLGWDSFPGDSSAPQASSSLVSPLRRIVAGKSLFFFWRKTQDFYF